MQNHVIPCYTMLYQAIPCNTRQYNAIPCNTVHHLYLLTERTTALWAVHGYFFHAVCKTNYHGPPKMTTLSCFFKNVTQRNCFPCILYYMCDCIHGLRPENLVLVWKPSGFCFPRGLISRLRGTLWSSVKVHYYVRIPWNSHLIAPLILWYHVYVLL